MVNEMSVFSLLFFNLPTEFFSHMLEQGFNLALKIIIYTMPLKKQPIKEQQSRCIFDGITSNLPIMRHAYVALIVLATVFSMAWYKIVRQHSLVVYLEISRLSLLFSWYTYPPKGSGVSRQNTSDSWNIARYTLDNVT